MIYARSLLYQLAGKNLRLIVTATKAGCKVAALELGWDLNGSPAEIAERLKAELNVEADYELLYFDVENIAAPIASGSYRVAGMIIVPCTMATISAIAQGTSSDLIERAADVVIKEKKKLLVVPRETPLSVIHLRNLLTLAEIGVTILPAMPAFYHEPQSIEEMVDFVVGKILDSLDIDHQVFRRWQGIND